MSERNVEAVDNDRLHAVLSKSRSLGFLGPGPIDAHIENAKAFALATDVLQDGDRVLDLGSGGGLPGLVVASERRDLAVVLLDGSERRCGFLRWAVIEMELERCSVLHGRAEGWAATEHRATFHMVMARSFGPPSKLAECSAPFLMPGGCVIVSEPPAADPVSRWPSDAIGQLGLTRDDRIDDGQTVLQRLCLATVCPDSFPRSTKEIAREPLF